jgi:hypothetical protein
MLAINKAVVHADFIFKLYLTPAFQSVAKGLSSH